jgi:hypothetical protein
LFGSNAASLNQWPDSHSISLPNVANDLTTDMTLKYGAATIMILSKFLRHAVAVGSILAALTGQSHAVTVTKFASGLYQSLYAITTDGTNLYVTGATGVLRDFSGGPANGVIGSIPLAGGSLTTLYSSSSYASVSGHVVPLQIASRGSKLFWADPDAGPSTGSSFIQGTSSGGTATQFFGNCCGAGVLPGDGIGIAVTKRHIYFSDSTGGRIGVDPSGSTATQIGPTRYTPDFATESWSQIAVANGKIFIADSGQQRGASGGKAAIFDESASLAPGVRWISVDGSSGFQDLSVGKIPNPQGIVAVGKKLYVTSGHTVWSVNQNTGKTTKLVSQSTFKDLVGITYTNGSLYVADSQTVFGPFVSGVAEATKDRPGVIWKITLP